MQHREESLGTRLAQLLAEAARTQLLAEAARNMGGR
jgi:hypothetical protein